MSTDLVPECAFRYCVDPASDGNFPYCDKHRHGLDRSFDVPSPEDDDD